MKWYTFTKRSIDFIGTKINKRTNEKDCITISGSPRTGTTWLMQILSQIHKSKTIFEPLHTTRFSIIEKLELPPRIFLPLDKENTALRCHLDKVFQGKAISKNPSYYLKYEEIKKRLIYDKIVVKFINSNRLLPWIAKRYTTKSNFLIIRNPCATINSQIKSGWIGYPKHLELEFRAGNINIVKKNILGGLNLIPDFQNNTKIVRMIQKINNMKELLAVEWALDYYVPLNYCKKDDFILIFYEELIKDKQKIIKDIFKNLNFSIPKNIDIASSIPSIASEEKKIDVERQLNKWKKNISKVDAEKIFNIAKLFDIDFYKS